MTLTRVYLGNPAGAFGMQALPAIPIGGPLGGLAGMTPTRGRSTGSSVLASGGTTTFNKPKTKSVYPIAWLLRTPADIELLMSFRDGGQGGGPYCLVDPSQQNFLPPNVARMSAVLLGALPEWSPTVGTLSGISTVTPPTGKLSGVAKWSGAGSGSILYAGLNNIVDGTWLPPIVSGLSHGFAIWARTASSTASLTAAFMYGVGGSAPAGTAATASAATLTTAWQQVAIGVASSFSWAATADYAMPKLTCGTASAPDIYLAASEFVYSTAATAGVLSSWVSGMGVPRVVLPGDASMPVGRPGLGDFAMTFAEA